MSFTRTFILTVIGLFWALPGGSLFAQHAWETLPVFHAGRVMPLHTFAQQVVRDICGTNRPFIVRDSTVMAEFNQILETLPEQNTFEQEGTSMRFRFLTPPPDFLDGGFNREWSIFDLSDDSLPLLGTELSTREVDRFHIERVSERIRQLIPVEGRFFTASEILFSWICEPEVWQYIPIFLVPETDYLDEMLGVSFRHDVRTSQYRVSLHQLETSQRYQQRLAEILRRHELGQTTRTPIPFDQITERLESQSQLFQELTFHPQRHRPARMLSLLYQAAGFVGDQSSYVHAFDAWEYLLTLGDIPGRQTTTRVQHSDSLTVFHPTTQRWHSIEDKLHLLMRIYDRLDSNGNPVFPNAIAVEQQYELLIDLIDANLAEAALLMESVYPGVPFRSAEHRRTVTVAQLLPMLGSPNNQQHQTTIRQVVLSYYYTVKKLRREIEAAYLALYDNGRSFRFLPVLSPLALELGSSQNNFGVQPWATSPMILGSGEAFVQRFFEGQAPTFNGEQPPTPTREAEETSENTEESDLNGIDGIVTEVFLDFLTDENREEQTDVAEEIETATEAEAPVVLTEPTAEELSLTDQLFQQSPMREWMMHVRLDEQSILRDVRIRFRMMFASYIAPGSGYRNPDFAIRADEFRDAVRPAAAHVEVHRALLVDEENKRMVEQFAKTAYPTPQSGLLKLLAEYRYDRLHPFYWMWILAMFAVILNGGAYIVSVIQRERTSVVARTVAIHSTTQEGKDEQTALQDYTNTFEEWLFISSVAMLTLSMLIAIIGAVMRASITGWAPVTNMYETIVMMALAAAMIGVWYALYPLLHPALKLAWVYSRFPRIGLLLELSAALKARKALQPRETAGEAAIREAAMEFGVPPSGITLGERRAFAQYPAQEDLEALRRIKTAQRTIVWQSALAVPRLFLTFAVFYAVVLLANEGSIDPDLGFWGAAAEMFVTSDTVDGLTVFVCTVLLVWITPHLLLTFLLTPIVTFRPTWIAAEQRISSFESKIVVEQVQTLNEAAHSRSEMSHRSEMSKVFHGEEKASLSQDTSGIAWLKQARNAALDRKLFIAIAAAVVFIAGVAASANRVEFNPDIRPIAAVLRSNFWLTVHVAAFIVGYAAAFIAWGMAVVSLGHIIFGRFRRAEPMEKGQGTRIVLPDACQLFTPTIERLLRIALLTIIVGTVLGGRWADYSWGRFWSWDPKEVWALITILFLVIVFHGRIARYYGTIGVTMGALLASIAVIVTWYGINFVFTSSVHAYGGGAQSNATFFLIAFIVANLLWSALALLRYCAEVYGNETE